MGSRKNAALARLFIGLVFAAVFIAILILLFGGFQNDLYNTPADQFLSNFSN